MDYISDTARRAEHDLVSAYWSAIKTLRAAGALRWDARFPSKRLMGAFRALEEVATQTRLPRLRSSVQRVYAGQGIILDIGPHLASAEDRSIAYSVMQQMQDRADAWRERRRLAQRERRQAQRKRPAQRA